MMEKYDLAVLPVVGNGGKLLGIITFDDILEVMEEEASEDMFRMAGIGSANPFDEAIIKRAYKRLPWLITTLIGGAFLAVIIGKFQPTLKQIVALVSFIPVIAGLGGNVGIQSSTITVRGLATGDIDGLKDIFWLLPREIGVGSAIGIVTGTVLAVMANLFLGSINPELATNGGITDLMEFCGILGISVFCGIFCAAIVGTTAPLVCHRIGLDPAVAAGPFVTVSIDVITQTIYLGIATMLLL
jgi:magnesium transporter